MEWQQKCGHGPWGGYGQMGQQMPWGMRMGMQCPVCGGQMMKPSKEEMIEILEHKKKRLQGVIDHLNWEIEKLKQDKSKEMPAEKPME